MALSLQYARVVVLIFSIRLLLQLMQLRWISAVRANHTLAQDRCTLVLDFAGIAFKSDYDAKHKRNNNCHKQYTDYQHTHAQNISSCSEFIPSENHLNANTYCTLCCRKGNCSIMNTTTHSPTCKTCHPNEVQASSCRTARGNIQSPSPYLGH